MAIENKILTFGTGKIGTVGGNKLMGYIKQFFPTEISGCYCWLDADDTTKTISGGRISEWRDKSGNLQHFSQSTAINRPYVNLNYRNGFSAVRFDNNENNFLTRQFSITKPQAITVFTVFDIDINSTRDANLVYWQTSSIGVGLFHSQPANKIGFFAGASVETYTKNKPFSLIAIAAIFNGVNSQIFENDIFKGTYNVGVNSLVGMSLGNQSSPSITVRFSGNLMEHIIFDRQLNSTEITQVNTYLIAKYGL